MKNTQPEHPRRSLRKIDENVIEHACKNACVKVANVKLVSKETVVRGWGRGGGGGGRSQVPTRTPACTEIGAGGEDVTQEPLVAVEPVGLQ